MSEPARKRRTRIDWDAVGDSIVEQYKSGKSTPELADAYDTSVSAMYNFLKEAGVMRSIKEAKEVQRSMNQTKPAFSKREYWLVWKLIDSLRHREVPFEGPNEMFAKDFDMIRDKCLDQAYDYKP